MRPLNEKKNEGYRLVLRAQLAVMPRGLKSPPAMPESLKSGVARQVGDIAPDHPRGLFVGYRLVLRSQLAVMPRGLNDRPPCPKA